MPVSSIDSIVGQVRLVNMVNALEPKISVLSDEQLRNKTQGFKEHIQKKANEHLAQIEELKGALLAAAIQEEKEKIKDKLKNTRNKIFEEILPEAFAVVREASRRTIGLRHFDVQIAGGIVLHEGKIAEMATGEGKTLVATLPAYLNALLGKGVHIVTVNDYLARRDREWMGPIYEFLGLTVGAIQHQMSDEERKIAYACDITYGTNNEFGFDYLRDNMKYRLEDLVQRPFYYAIVDEVDSILVDEARTPLIISGPAEESTDKYYIVDKIVPRLKGRVILEKDEIEAKYKGENLSQGFDYIVDEKAHTAHLTEEGETKACQFLGVSDLHSIETMEWRHHIIQALRAHKLYNKDVDYVAKDGQVIIVDEFTGRLMPGRRWSDGLHQAVEAKEGLKIERENQTLATITFQNYFRMYEKLAGMTGTAFTEANEFKNIYKLDVIVIPTNRQLIRNNYPDRIYKTEKEKFEAVVEEIKELYHKGKPVLVGTISIEKSEHLSSTLKRNGIPHQVLNAKYHEMEAQIVAQAGRYQAVTIATNMAGRGTDILLGGNPEFMAKNLIQEQVSFDDPNYAQEYKKLLEKFKQETDAEHKKVVELGGLHVIGTERHEARRIDNQLRGRSGRQGDPGSSRFYVSLGDDLMRLFGSDRLIGIMDRLGLEQGQVIEHPWVTRSIEIAQRRVEQHNFEIRKQLLEYDNVMNKQREVVYSQRWQMLEGLPLKEEIFNITTDILNNILGIYINENISPQDWDTAGLINMVRLKFGVELDTAVVKGGNKNQIKEDLLARIIQAYEAKEQSIGKELMHHLELMAFLQIIDAKWKDHLYAMDSLREGIGLRAYGQRDPLIEYKREAFEMFNQMISGIEEEAVEIIFRLQPIKPGQFRGVFSSQAQEFLHPEVSQFEEEKQKSIPLPNTPLPLTSASFKHQDKVGRNDPCPCGSKKKYKKCCGR
ncbi:MAG: preprotein translocase subunit SecA [Omnitrophica WOR_2 bacterium RBG_13_41_10]|nr:MAG: preprotein translocase subunit SecA [Omnitrophica WOR_2 bacterium RBG_13_41_10]